MLLNCCTQYANTFGKLSSGHRTRNGEFSFQSQRKAMPRNVQTAVQLCSFHSVARLCLESFKLGFRSMYIKNFQMYKLDLEKGRGASTKLPTSVGSSKKQESSRKTSALLTMSKPLTLWIKANCKKIFKR